MKGQPNCPCSGAGTGCLQRRPQQHVYTHVFCCPCCLGFGQAALLLPVHLQLSELKRFSSPGSKCSKNSNVYLLALFWFEPICASKCIVLYGYCRIDEAGKNEAVSGDWGLSFTNKMSICKLVIEHKIYQNLLSHRHIAQSWYTDIIMIVYLCRNMFGFCIL